MDTYIINGKFLSQRMTGVQRYAYELTVALDSKPGVSGFLCLGVPPDTKKLPDLHQIPVIRIGTHTGVMWEQGDFPDFCRKNHYVPLNLCNAIPLRCPGIVCIHDVKVKRFPSFFTWRFRLWYNLMFGVASRKARSLLTVSEFSKREIVATLRVSAQRITVIPNGWQHLQKIVPDPTVLDTYHVADKQFFFMLGSLEPNKNLAWLAKEARQNPDELFLVSGNIDKNVFSQKNQGLSFPPNVSFIGFASDEEVKGLMKHCKALLFPSFYEGFGVPPLEALSVGCPVIVSDIPVLREIYHDAAIYIDPSNASYHLSDLLAQQTKGAAEVLASYSWDSSARKLLSLLEKDGKR